MSLKKYAKHLAAAALGLALPAMVFAQGTAGGSGDPFVKAKSQTQVIANGAFGGTAPAQDLTTIVGKIINVALGFMGIFLLVYVMYAGFLWMTADGKEAAVGEAQTRIKNAVIGLIIILSAFAISNFVITQLTTITTGRTL
jgi:putative copper export protein